MPGDESSTTCGARASSLSPDIVAAVPWTDGYDGAMVVVNW
jgi:hypothetical protein